MAKNTPINITFDAKAVAKEQLDQLDEMTDGLTAEMLGLDPKEFEEFNKLIENDKKYLKGNPWK